MAHDHGSHAAVGTGGARHRRPLLLACAIALAVFVAEVVGSAVTGSLALLSDAGHVLTDALGVGMALAAIQLAQRGSKDPQRSFGVYRLEILAALANAVLLLGVGIYVLVEAIRRWGNPEPLDVGPLLAFATVGLVGNAVGVVLLRRGASSSLNVQGAYLEVLADLLGSFGVLLAAAVTGLTGWPYADPIIAVAIGLFVVPRAVKLGGQAMRVLLQAAPPDVPVGALTKALAEVEGVIDVHDVHVWTLTSNMDVASAHLRVAPDADSHGVLDRSRTLLAERFRIVHATLQVEPDDHRGCEELTW